jgi:hypothetical protein
VANIAWSFATLGFKAPKLFEAIERRSVWLVEEGNPQSVATIAWSFARLGFNTPKLFGAIESHSDWLVEEGTPQEVANTAWSFATLGFKAPKLFEAIERRSVWLVEEGNPQSVATIAWSFARLGFNTPKLFGAIESLSDWLVEEGTPQGVANVAWSLAILCLPLQHNSVQGRGHRYELLLMKFWSFLLEVDSTSFGDEFHNQVSQVFVYARASGISLRCTINTSILLSDTTTSNSQREVSRLLNEIGFEHQEEVSPFVNDVYSTLPAGMLSIDMANTEQMIAIEFDGPHHFVTDVSTGAMSENGPTNAKRWFLEQLGWKVINVRFTDWNNAGGKEAKKDFLRKVLASK